MSVAADSTAPETASTHVSVMPEEVRTYLRLDAGGTFLDCTLGGGGHAAQMLAAHPLNRVVAVDRDQRAIARARVRFHADASRIRLVHASFADLSDVSNAERFRGMLADLGMSSDQIAEQRGFSFGDSGTLDMRMDETQVLTAHDVVNTYSERDLIAALKRGGVKDAARPIVKAIIANRPIRSTEQLATLIADATPKRLQTAGFHPATIPFQAIRIEVNQEFDQIEQLLDHAPKLLEPQGRLAVITFHSGEDKIVASRMRRWESGDSAPALWRNRHSRAPVDPHTQDRSVRADAGLSLGKFLTKKAVTPQAQEVERNTRARSARLRVFEFV